MQRFVVLVLCLVALTGCSSFHYSAFGVPLNASDGTGLNTEETIGTILLLGIAIAVSVAGVAALTG